MRKAHLGTLARLLPIFHVPLVAAFLILSRAASGEPAAGPSLQLRGSGLDLRRAGLQTDVTGSRVRLAPAAGPPIAFSLAERVLRRAEAMDSAMQPRQAPGGADLSYQDGALVAREAGGPERWRAAVPAPVTAAQVSGDGRLALAVLADGTVRWYGAATGQPLLAMFFHADRKRWVAFTPSGYYDAAAGGEDLLGWQVPRGAGQAPDFFRIALFRERYHRPDLIGRVIFAQDEQRALDELNAEAGRRPDPVPLSRLFPPVVRVLSPAAATVASGRQVTVRYAVRSPSGEPVQVRVFVRGQLTATRAARLDSPRPIAPAGADEVVRDETVEMPPEDATVVLVAETALATADPVLLPLRWEGKRGTVPVEKPDLHVLAIGVSEYQQGRLHLDFAAKDARDLAAAFLAQQGKRYGRAEVRVLTDRQARRADIADGLDWLRRRASPGGVSVVLFAGHGTNDPATGKYYLLPQDARSGDLATMYGGDELQRALARVPGRVLVFLDTCHAGSLRGPRGAVDLSEFTDKLASIESSVVVYMAASGEQTSKESVRWGNGVFTKAAVEGIRGLADYRGTGEVRVSTLESYISERVRALTHEEQTPTSAKPGTVPDFLVALVRPRYALERKWWFWGAVGVAAAGIVTGSLLATKPWADKPMTIPVGGM